MSAPSESTVAPRFGTLWRWRAIVAMISVAVFAAGWNVARWWRARVLVRDSGQPAIVRVVRPDYDSLELFDWTTGKWQKFGEVRGIDYWFMPNAIRVVLDGEAVAWHWDDRIHVVPTDGSTAWTSKPFKVAEHVEFLGLTRDDNFAVVRDRNEGIANLKRMPASTSAISVVNLQTGEVVNSETWAVPSPVRSTGEVVATRISPEEYGRWRFSRDGKWTKIADVKDRLLERHSVTFTIDSNGQLQWPNSRLTEGATIAPEAFVACVSPLGDRFVANFQGGGCVVVDQNTGKIMRLDLPWGICPMGSFTPDGNTLVISDLRDDIHVFDASTGRLIAKDDAGSRRRGILVGILTVAGFVIAFWLLIAFSEQSSHWATFDVLATILVIALTMVGIVISIRHPGIDWTHLPVQAIVQFFGSLVVGTSAGGVVLTAWYWAHGEGTIAARWVKGVPGLAVFLLPILMLDQATSWWYAALVTNATAIFAAGSTALFVWIPNAIGWTIRNQPVEKSSHRFGLSAMFAAIASLGIVLALGKWLIDPSKWSIQSEIVYQTAEIMLVGAVLVAILFSRWSWYWIAGGLLLVGTPLIALICFNLVGMSARNPYLTGAHAMQFGRLIGMTLAILVACLVMKHHGFRWTRAVTPLRSPSVVQA